MTPSRRAGRKAVAAALSAAILLLSPGGEASRALAQVVQTPYRGGAPASGPLVVPAALARPVVGAVGQGLPAVSLSGSVVGQAGAPELRTLAGAQGAAAWGGSPRGRVSRKPSGDALAARGVAAGAPAASPAARHLPVLAQGGQVVAGARRSPLAGDGPALPSLPAAPLGEVQALARDLAPHLAASLKVKDVGDESASGIGERLEAVMLGRRPALEPAAGEPMPPAAVGSDDPSGLDAPAVLRRAGNEVLGGADGSASLQAPPRPAAEGSALSLRSQARPGSLGRVGRWFKGLFRVLPDPERNRQFWRFLLTQCLVAVGMSFHNTAMPNLAGGPQGRAANLGYARAAGWASQAASNVTTGPLIDRHPVQRTLAATYLARTVVLFSLPILFFHGWLSFPVLLTVLFAAGYLESMSTSAESVAQMRIMGGDERYYSKVNAVSGLLVSLVGVIAPLAAGALIGWLDARLWALAGSALAYAVYGAAALAGAALFGRWLSLPREGIARARSMLRDLLKGERGKSLGVKAVYAAKGDKGAVLVVEVAGKSRVGEVLPSEFEGYAVRIVERRGVRGALREFAEGFRILWSNRYLRLTCLVFPVVYMMTSDAIFYTALPSFIQAGLKSAVGSALIEGVPVIGPMVAGLGTKAGAFGLFLAANALGAGLSTFWMMLRQSRLAGAKTFQEVSPAGLKKGKGRLSPLEREGVWTSILHGLGALAFIGVFLSPNLWLSAGAMLLTAFLRGPAAVTWWSLTQKAIRDSHPESMGKVYSAMYFYNLVLSVVGVLVFGGLMGVLAAGAAFWVIAAAMAAAAVLDFVEPYVVFPVSRR
ncbi:MAG: hypothetical protein HY927_05360 [Elusimicrobia bacterium]|nr:hypothetical protein [Elusimicrobiota bacterium]